MPDPSRVRPTLPEPVQPDLDVYGVDLDLPFGAFDADRKVFNPAEESIPDLLDRLDTMIQNDGHMAALYRLVTLPLRRARWRLEPAPGGEKEAAFIEAMLTSPPHLGGMSTSMDYIMSLLAKATLMGFSTFEEVYQVIPFNGRPAVTLRKLAPREQRSVRFHADREGGFDGLTQTVSRGGVGKEHVRIPRDKTFFWTVDKEHHPFYGRSMFLPALFHYDRKHRLYWIAHIAAQFSAVPGRIGYVDSGADLTPTQREKFRNALANFGFNTAMTPPKGTRIEAFSSNNAGAAEQILSLIEHHNVQASQAVLAEFIDLGQGGSATGSYALSNDASSMFLLGEEALLSSISETLNWHLLPKFIDWNFGTRKYPKIVFDPLADEMREAMTQVFTAISVSPEYRGTDEFLFEIERQLSSRLGLPIDYETIEQERDAAKTAADKVADVINRLTSTPVVAEIGAGETTDKPDPEDAPVETAEQRHDRLWLSDAREALARFTRVQELSSDSADAEEEARPLVSDIQSRLSAVGYASDDEEGVFGESTKKAVVAFQAFIGLPTTGSVDLGTYALLLEMTHEVEIAQEG